MEMFDQSQSMRLSMGAISYVSRAVYPASSTFSHCHSALPFI